MDLLQLLKTPQWQNIQLYWESLSAISEQVLEKQEQLPLLMESEEDELPENLDLPVSIESFIDPKSVDWDQLRLLIDRRLNEMQPLVLKQLISPLEREIIEQLVHRRFDQSLQRLNWQRQQQHRQYAVSQDPYLRPRYSRYHAMREVEVLLQKYKTNLHLKDLLSLSVTQHILEDTNMELIELYARYLSAEKKESDWQTILESVIALSCNEIADESATHFVLDLMEKEDTLKLALRVLQASGFERSIESALRVFERKRESSVLPSIQKLLERQDISYVLQKRAFNLLSQMEAPAALDAILKVVSAPTDDYEQKGIFYHDVREAAIKALAHFRNTPHQPRIIDELQQYLGRKSWSPVSQLTALKILASFGVYVGFDIAVMALQMSASRDYLRIQELAAETLVALKDKRAIPFLISALNETTRSETVIERFGGAFQKDKQQVVGKLCLCLQQFGILMAQDMVTGEWFQDD